MKKNSLNIIVSLCVAFSFYGCANLNNATLISGIQDRNKELRKEDAPIRLKYKEYNQGITFHPYLIGKVAPTTARPLLIKDTLNAIKTKYKDKEENLVQTRFVSANKVLTSIKEVWVVKNEKAKMYAYLVNFIVVPTGGIDINIHGGSIVFPEMLKQ